MIAEHGRAALLVRFDDVRGIDARLGRAWDVLERRGVPIHLEVVPGWLDGGGSAEIAERARRARVPVEVHQHGADHDNRGDDARRYEFGDDRSLADQLAAIRAGRAVLEDRLPEWFRPIFSPPWNRYGATTLEALAQAGFAALSCLERTGATTHPSVVHIPMSTDPIRWRPEPTYRPWNETQAELFDALDRAGVAGLELHHAHLDDQDLDGLDRTLAEIVSRPVRCPTMTSFAEERSR